MKKPPLALHRKPSITYSKLVYALTQRKGFSQYKYDLYDFSYNIFCYKETTLKIFRYETYIYLIRSTEPISIEEFERINPYIS